MSRPRSTRAGFLRLIAGMTLATNLVGCGSGNPNEREFFEHAPPGLPTDHPNETYAERRERTRTRTKQELAAEAKNKAAEAKKADGKSSR